MSPWEIIIPIVWAGGFLGAALLISKHLEGDYFPDYFFPLVGAAGLLIFGLGLLGALYESIFIIVTVILAIYFVMLLWIVRHSLLFFITRRIYWVIAILIPLIWYSLASLSYPVSTDALYFHLGLPKIFAAAGHIFYIPANLFSAAPMTSEMLTTGFYSLGLERGAQLFIVLVTAVFVLSIWRRAAELGGSGIMAVLLMLTIPILISQVVGSKNDYLLWGMSFFAILKFVQFDQGRGTHYLILSGIGAGMAAGTKAIGLALLGPFVLILLYNTFLGKYKILSLVQFVIAFVLFASPWYIYSWIVAGNPVYPFFDNIFRSPYLSALLNFFNSELAVKTADRNLLNLILSPFRLVFDPRAYDGRIGYCIILFPALLLFVRRVPQALKLALGISIIYWLIWYFGFPYARFILPVAAIWAIGGSCFLASAQVGARTLRISAFMALAIGIALPLPAVVRDTFPRVKAVVAGTAKYDFLENYRVLDPYRTESGETIEALPYIKCWEYINDSTPAASRVGILASYFTRADGYYLDRDFIYLNPSEQNQYDFTVLRADTAIISALENLGIDYVVFDSVVIGQFSPESPWSGIDGFQQIAPGVSSLRACCEKNGLVVYSDSRFQVYKL